MTTDWQGTIKGVAPILDRWPEEEGSITATAQAIGALLREQPYYEEDGDYELAVDELIGARDEDGVGYFNACLDALYDWADENRVWIDPIK